MVIRIRYRGRFRFQRNMYMFCYCCFSRKEWRKLFKKLRRKRIRQKLARQLELLEAEWLANPNYIAYCHEKELLEIEEREREEERSRYENALWLDREIKAQHAFEEKRRQLEQTNREENEKRERIRKEYEEQERKAKEAKAEKDRLLEEYRKKQLERERLFAEFLVGVDDHAVVLKEIIHTRPNQNPCTFYGKIGACRYSVRCSADHLTPGLSEVDLSV